MEENEKNYFTTDLLKVNNEPLHQFLQTIEGTFEYNGKIQIYIHAIKEKIFDYLHEPKNVEEIASRFGWNLSLTQLYCLSLASLKLIKTVCNVDNEPTIRYINCLEADMFLTSFSPLSQLNNLQNKINRVESWQNLTQALKSGPITVDNSQLFTQQWITGIAESSLDGQIPKLIEIIKNNIDISHYHSLLDLGGGHGYYSIAFSDAFPNLECTVFDLPQITPITRDLTNRFIKSNTKNPTMNPIKIISGDYLKDQINGKFDIVFSSFSRCGSDPQLIDKISNILNPKGAFIIRRHAEHLNDDPIHNLEWNLKIPASRKKITGRYNLTEYPSIKEYIALLEKNNFKVIFHKPFDDFSNLIIAIKI